jgi:steroid delta-isomerase-like uncharacterized protein
MGALVLFSTVVCQNKTIMEELKAIKNQVEIENQNKVRAKYYVNAFNRSDYEAMTEFLSPDYEVYCPSGNPNPTSREQRIENYKTAAGAISEFTWQIEDLIAAEDKVIARVIATGTYKGGIPGLPIAAKKLEFSMITIMLFQDGRIVKEWQEDDQLGFARQLDMELMPKEDKK